MQLKLYFKIFICFTLLSLSSSAGEKKGDDDVKKYSKEEKKADYEKEVYAEKKEDIDLEKPLEEMTTNDFYGVFNKYGRKVYVRKLTEFLELKLKPILKKNEISAQDELLLKENYFILEDNEFYKIRPYLLFAWAKLQNQKGITKGALLMLKRIPAKSYPSDIAGDALLLKGKLQYENGNYGNSRSTLYKASKSIGEVTPEINYLIGCNFLEQKEYLSASKVFNKVIESSIDSNLLVKTQNKQALALYNSGDAEAAVKAFQKAIQLKGEKQDKSYLEYLKIAESYYAIGEYEKAEEFIQKFQETKFYEVNSTKDIEVLKQMSFYLDSIEQYQSSLKILQLHNQLTDSLISGNQSMNEVYQIELLAKQREISDNAIRNLVKEDQLKEEALSASKLAMTLLGSVLVLALIAGLYILRVSKQRRIANQKLALRSLRSQMNPHFIFNALNSVNSFISENDQRSANKFLTSFSRLMRLVMENSEHDFIPLQKELEILEIYLYLEHFRFKDQFAYNINLDDSIDEEEFHLPPMLIQPYIENAIWHGLRYKQDSGILNLDLKQRDQNLIVTISDNGIGRKKSAELKTANQKKNKSTALRNIKQRVEIVKELHGLKIEVSITDLNDDASGTIVELIIPQSK